MGSPYSAKSTINVSEVVDVPSLAFELIHVRDDIGKRAVDLHHGRGERGRLPAPRNHDVMVDVVNLCIQANEIVHQGAQTSPSKELPRPGNPRAQRILSRDSARDAALFVELEPEPEASRCRVGIGSDGWTQILCHNRSLAPGLGSHHSVGGRRAKGAKRCPCSGGHFTGDPPQTLRRASILTL